MIDLSKYTTPKTITTTNQFGQNPTQIPNPNYINNDLVTLDPIEMGGSFIGGKKPAASSDAASVAASVNGSVPNTVPGQTIQITPQAKSVSPVIPIALLGALLVFKFL